MFNLLIPHCQVVTKTLAGGSVFQHLLHDYCFNLLTKLPGSWKQNRNVRNMKECVAFLGRFMGKLSGCLYPQGPQSLDNSGSSVSDWKGVMLTELNLWWTNRCGATLTSFQVWVQVVNLGTELAMNLFSLMHSSSVFRPFTEHFKWQMGQIRGKLVFFCWYFTTWVVSLEGSKHGKVLRKTFTNCCDWTCRDMSKRN